MVVMPKMAYRYWREFLKRSDAYAQCCAEEGRGPLAHVFEHFGDVFSVGFEEWWENGKSKFQVEEEFLVNVVRTRAEFAQVFDDDADDLLAFVVNLNAPISRVLRELERVLRHQIGRLLNIDVAEPSGNFLDSGEENRVITVKVCNYYRKARALIANAEVGVFPSYR